MSKIPIPVPGVTYSKMYIFLLVFIILAGLVVPTAIYGIPHGTDVYTHLVYTKIMSKTTSLHDFYQECSRKGFLTGLDYPYGLWLFASLTTKIAGISPIKASILLPLVNLAITATVYYLFARKSLNVATNLEKYSLISVIMLLSIPYEAIGVVNFSPSMFFMGILIFILYLTLYEEDVIKKYLLLALTVPVLVASHAGTTIFLLSFLIVYSIIYSTLNKKVNVDLIFLIILILFSYHFIITSTPWINGQYIDKGRFIISVGDLFYKVFRNPLFKDISENVYTEIFVDNNTLYYIFVVSTVYTVSYLLTYIRLDGIKKRLKKLKQFSFAAAPLGVSRLPHTPPFWAVWLNPVYVFLAAIGAFKADRTIKALLISLIIVLLPSAYVAGARGLRELHYFFVILPIVAAQGFYTVERKIKNFGKTAILKKVLLFSLSLLFFLQAVVIVMVGNYFYFPKISLQEHEKSGLEWLSGVGKPNEGATGSAYGDRIFVYGDKIPPDTTFVSAGAETVRFYRDLHDAHFTTREYPLKDLYSTFGVKYYILSKRTFKMYEEGPEKIKMNENEYLDRIYSSQNIFSIYKYITSPTKRVNLVSRVSYGSEPLIKDAGTSFLVQTEDYKVRISKEKPKVLYIGNSTSNYLGDGEEYEFLSVRTWENSYFYVLDEDVNYEKITLGKNVLTYEGTLKGSNDSKIATIRITLEFFEHAFRRTVEVCNDISGSSISIEYADDLTLLANYFKFGGAGKIIDRRIYPNEDYSLIKDKKFSWIYIRGSGNDGIYIKFEPTSPFPAKILYKGLVGYEGYALIRIYVSQEWIWPGEEVKIVQWFSIGNFEDAKKRIDKHTFVSMCPYPNKPPLIIIGIKKGELSSEWLRGLEVLKELGAKEYVLAGGKNASISGMDIKIIPILDVKNPNLPECKGVYAPSLNKLALEVLNESGVSYVLGKVIPVPFEYLYEEGYRLPKLLEFQGKNTGIVLLPISFPALDERNRVVSRDSLHRVIDAALDYDGILVFKWNANMLDRSGNYEVIKEAVNYAIAKGYEFADPEEVAEYVKKLQNIALEISSESGRIAITVYNEGNEPVKNLTLKVRLKSNPSAISGAELVRSVRKDNTVLVYLSTDVPPSGNKKIAIKL